MKPLVRQQAVDTLRAGGTLACPTEAVWGLSCDPDNEAAVTKILDLKNRPVHKGMILVAGDAQQFDVLLAGLPAEKRQQVLDSWPGPFTWLVPHQNLIPAWVSGDSDKVAIRVTSHPELAELCRAFGPIVSTSANPAGEEPARSEDQVRGYFVDGVDYYLSGETLGAKSPSTIKDALSGETLR